jgi:hypothetical protein
MSNMSNMSALRHVTPSLLMLLWLGSCPGSHAAGVPSLCRPGEFVLATGQMLRIDNDASERRSKKKVVSVCADRKDEPYEKLVYRFGAPAALESEIVASGDHKAGIYMDSDSGAHVGAIAIVFYAGPYSYVLSEALGMADGLTLLVYRHNVRLAAFSSVTYESNMTSIDASAPKSATFRRTKPIEPM